MSNKYTWTALERASGVSARTLREWIRKKVLPPPIGGGRGAHYDDRHVAAARVIRHLRASGEALSAIRTRVAGRSESELHALLPAPVVVSSAAAGVEGKVEASPPPVQNLQLIELMDGLTLLVNADRGWQVRRVAEEIYRQYGGRGREG
jgi:DNA-binding transcriptional MerR regulator